MTPAQLSTFKAAILADANLTAARAANDHGQIAAYYGGAGTGFYWRPAISTAELNTAIDWSVFATLAVQVQNTYFAMTAPGAVNSTSANIRNGFAAVFPNSGGTAATLTALTALAKKVPTKFEEIFTSANVCTAVGVVPTVADVIAALAS